MGKTASGGRISDIRFGCIKFEVLLSGSIQYTIGYRSFELRREVEEISFEGSSVYTRYSSLWDR